MPTLEQAKAFFANDRYATEATGIVIEEARQGYARCRLELDARHRNAVGGVMGGVMFTMADFVFAISTNFEVPSTVTTVANISFLSAAKGDTLYGESRLIKDGRSTCVCEVSITDNTGAIVALVTMHGMHLQK